MKSNVVSEADLIRTGVANREYIESKIAVTGID